ncbi:hypothetical protein [Actinoplanes sp. NPDC049599]|uniref:hypothetical protein n=1 Tax=Actinoplanes sp. NPDC049599 TaxID=3363903 RepID=UPI0037B3F315
MEAWFSSGTVMSEQLPTVGGGSAAATAGGQASTPRHRLIGGTAIPIPLRKGKVVDFAMAFRITLFPAARPEKGMY